MKVGCVPCPSPHSEYVVILVLQVMNCLPNLVRPRFLGPVEPEESACRTFSALVHVFADFFHGQLRTGSPVAHFAVEAEDIRLEFTVTVHKHRHWFSSLMGEQGQLTPHLPGV